MKKNKKMKISKIEFQLDANEMLELLNFLEFVRDEKEAWCNSAGKVHRQLREIVISRIEGRKPRVVLDANTTLSLDSSMLQKLAFEKTNLDPALAAEKFNVPSTQEIIETMDPPSAEKITTDGEINAIVRKQQERDEFFRQISAEIADSEKKKILS